MTQDLSSFTFFTPTCEATSLNVWKVQQGDSVCPKAFYLMSRCLFSSIAIKSLLRMLLRQCSGHLPQSPCANDSHSSSSKLQCVLCSRADCAARRRRKLR